MSLDKILVVDDEEGLRRMLQILLTKEGYQVTVAEDGKDALGRLAKDPPDLVLCDVRMPSPDGLALLDIVRTKQLGVPFLMMSAYADHDVAIQAVKLGALDYISKPFKADEVLLKIRIALERLGLLEERKRLSQENQSLKGQLSREYRFDTLIGRSPAMMKVFNVVKKVADYKTTVLLLGESGTGKELVARAIHHNSGRSAGPFVPINCGAIPENLLESELFGHVRGAFTDASRDRKGLIEEAVGGTLFLDEIGELPLTLQVKLLRFLQEEEIRRVGDTKDLKVDVRVVAATVRDLATLSTQGQFREDLYYRLNVLPIHIPPLRERGEDVALLVEHFVTKYAQRLGRPQMRVTPRALKLLVAYPWPGNVRELENAIERAMVLAEGDVMDADALPERVQERSEAPVLTLDREELSIKKTVRAIERQLIERALQRTNGNRTRAALMLEISHRALLYKIKEYGLR